MPITRPVFDVSKIQSVTYFFYTTSLNFQIPNAKITSCGNGSIVACNAKDSTSIKKILPNIYGESIRIKNYTSETLKDIINKYGSNIVKKELVDNYDIILCFDNSLPNFVTIDETKVNVQIAISQNEINVGYPLILNGY